MLVVCGGALALYAFRLPPHRTTEHVGLATRGGMIIVNNLFLLAACGTVALGTLYPMALEIITHERVSVGAPFSISLCCRFLACCFC